MRSSRRLTIWYSGDGLSLLLMGTNRVFYVAWTECLTMHSDGAALGTSWK